MSLMNTATDEEKNGVEAIQFGVTMAGKKEPEWVSLKTWRALYDDERAYILNTYRAIRKEIEEDAKRKEESIQASESPGDDRNRSE